MIVKLSRGLVLIAAIPVLAACGNGTATTQIPVSSSYSVAPESSSHAPTSSKPAAVNSSKAAAVTPAPAVTPHANAAPVVTPAPVHNNPVQNAPVQNTPVQTHAPAVNHTATAVAPQAVSTPTRTGSTPVPRSTSSAIAPTNKKAPVVVAPHSPATKATQPTNTTKFTAALVTQTGKGIASPTTRLKDGTWRVYVTGINATSVTVKVLGTAKGAASDEGMTQIGTQVIPLSSTNISTILPAKNVVSSGKGFPGITAPAWAYTEIFNQGQVGLNKVVADSRYTISPALKSKINPTFATTPSGTKSVYSDITIKNGVVTGLEWTFHP